MTFDKGAFPMGKRITLLLLAIFALTAGTASAAGTKVRGPFFGTVHAVGSVTYKDASQKSWTWDRGRITALSADSITLTRRDRAQVTFVITPSTLVRSDRATYHLTDLRLGLAATVISQSGTAAIIRNLRGEGAPSGADQSAIEGPGAASVTGTIAAQYADGTQQSFDYNRGRIVSAANGQLTIKRADGQSVTFTYDASTVVRTGDGSISSVDDLHVGKAATFFSQSGALKLVRQFEGLRNR
jgi:Domain of unknown function (DUF5666)